MHVCAKAQQTLMHWRRKHWPTSHLLFLRDPVWSPHIANFDYLEISRSVLLMLHRSVLCRNSVPPLCRERHTGGWASKLASFAPRPPVYPTGCVSFLSERCQLPELDKFCTLCVFCFLDLRHQRSFGAAVTCTQSFNTTWGNVSVLLLHL